MAVLFYQVACGTIVAGALNFKPGNASALVPPVIGGLLVGASQAASLVLTGRSLGGEFSINPYRCISSMPRKHTQSRSD